MYSNSVSVIAQQENEAKINTEIEQDGCKKDTGCENENEMNNKLKIVNNRTQSQVQTETKLNVIKHLSCTQGDISSPCHLDPEDFIITITGNNPSSSQFPGSEQGTLVALGPGGYTVSEETNEELPQTFEFNAEFPGDCFQSDDFEAEVTIAEGETQRCTIENQLGLQED